MTTKLERLELANKFIECIASHGRRFFEYVHDDGRLVARFKIDQGGKIWFFNEWKRTWIYVSKYGAWRGFHHGGTLHGLVGMLVEFIKTGKQLNAGYFGDYWAYGDDMQKVVSKGVMLGVVE